MKKPVSILLFVFAGVIAHPALADAQSHYQDLMRAVFEARGQTFPEPPPPPRPTLITCKDDFFGDGTCSESDLPYSAAASQSISRLPKPDVFDIASLTLKGSTARFRVINVTATDSTKTVVPYIDGLSSGLILNKDQEIEFALMSPPTNGRQVSLSYSFSIEGLDGASCEQCDFSYRVTFTSN